MPPLCLYSIPPALGASVRSVRLVAGRLEFYSRSGQTKDFKSSICSFPPGARHKRKCGGLSVRLLVVYYMSSNSVNSFMTDICNEPPMEKGLPQCELSSRCPVPLPFCAVCLGTLFELLSWVEKIQ